MELRTWKAQEPSQGAPYRTTGTAQANVSRHRDIRYSRVLVRRGNRRIRDARRQHPRQRPPPPPDRGNRQRPAGSPHPHLLGVGVRTGERPGGLTDAHAKPFPARAAIAVGIPRPATSTPFVYPARRNGSAVTETMRPASLILIGHNPGGGPVMPRVPLVLTGPAGPSVPARPRHRQRLRDRMGRSRPGPLRPVAAQRRRRAVRAGRGRRGGELHRPVPDGRNRPRTSPPSPPSRPPSRTPPPWSSPASASPWRCTAAARCGPGH